MTIVYAVICRASDATILVENTSSELKGNAAQVTLALMQHLRDHPELVEDGDHKTLKHRNDEEENDFFDHFVHAACTATHLDDDDPDEHFFHLLLKDDVFYCCLGDDPASRDQVVNFAFLDHIHQEFNKHYRPRRIQSANAYAMEKKFMPILRSAVHYHNVNAAKIGQDKHVQTALGKVEDMKVVMGRNLNLLMERGENIDALASKSDFLREDASIFRRKSMRMRNKMQRKWICMAAIIAAIVLVLIYMVVVGVCGIGLDHCRSSSGNSEAAANDDGGSYSGGEKSGYGGQDDDGGGGN